MIWDRHEKDYYRWRTCFAWFPKRIGKHRVWLSKYAYRHLNAAEEEEIEPRSSDIPLLLSHFSDWTMWQVPTGYTCLLRKEYSTMGHFTYRTWRELPDNKAPLNVVTLPTSGDME